MHVRCGGTFNDEFMTVLLQSTGEIILEIGQHLAVMAKSFCDSRGSVFLDTAWKSLLVNSYVVNTVSDGCKCNMHTPLHVCG